MLTEEKIRLLKYLTDALNAAENIQIETQGLNVKSYESNSIKWLVKRGIEIISEALKRANMIDSNLPVSDLSKIYATRNKIAHEYDVVDHYQLYNIVQKHMPSL